jgi:hypothetical protein
MGASNQIPSQSFFGKCRVLISGPLQRRGFKLGSSRQQDPPELQRLEGLSHARPHRGDSGVAFGCY